MPFFICSWLTTLHADSLRETEPATIARPRPSTATTTDAIFEYVERRTKMVSDGKKKGYPPPRFLDWRNHYLNDLFSKLG